MSINRDRFNSIGIITRGVHENMSQVEAPRDIYTRFTSFTGEVGFYFLLTVDLRHFQGFDRNLKHKIFQSHVLNESVWPA